MKLALLSLALFLFSPYAAALGGGSEDCATPQPVVTNVVTRYDAQANPSRAEGEHDAWFSWVAGHTGPAALLHASDEGEDALSVAVYAGSGCPDGPAVARGAAGQARVTFEAEQGSTYVIRFRNAAGAQPRPGSFVITLSSVIGNDDCATAFQISGEGTFNFEPNTATTGAEGQLEPLCQANGSPGIDNDVWFDWTASASGIATLETCDGFVIGDSKVAVYEGAGCPTAPAVSCNDDACSFERTRVTWPVVAGNVYAIQAGATPGGFVAFGEFFITIEPRGGTGANTCGGATPIFDVGTFNFDSSNATQGGIGQASMVCDLNGTTNFDNDIWFDWTCYQYGIATISTCGSTTIDTRMSVRPFFEGVSCLGAIPPRACNDDACGEQSRLVFVVQPSMYKLQIGTFPGTPGGPGTFDVSVQPTVGASYCDPTVPNSTGASSRLVAAGSTVVADQNLTLAATDLPPNQTTLFLASRAQGFVAAPGCCTVGNLCLGGDFARFSSQVRNSGLPGEVIVDVDLMNMQTNPPQPVLAGQTWNFQAWHRDFGGTGNLTQGVEVTFN